MIGKQVRADMDAIAQSFEAARYVSPVWVGFAAYLAREAAEESPKAKPRAERKSQFTKGKCMKNFEVWYRYNGHTNAFRFVADDFEQARERVLIFKASTEDVPRIHCNGDVVESIEKSVEAVYEAMAAVDYRAVAITPDMVEAGVQVLRESGALSLELSADHVLVQRLLEAALAASQVLAAKPAGSR